jgi:transposase InsO family protein
VVPARPTDRVAKIRIRDRSTRTTGRSSRATQRCVGAQKERSNCTFIDPGKPTQNAQIESLNGKIRDELLNAHSFMTIFEARREAADWWQDYNEVRPHSALGYRTPREFAEQVQTSQPSNVISGFGLKRYRAGKPAPGGVRLAGLAHFSQ